MPMTAAAPSAMRLVDSVFVIAFELPSAVDCVLSSVLTFASCASRALVSSPTSTRTVPSPPPVRPPRKELRPAMAYSRKEAYTVAPSDEERDDDPAETRYPIQLRPEAPSGVLGI